MKMKDFLRLELVAGQILEEAGKLYDQVYLQAKKEKDEKFLGELGDYNDDFAKLANEMLDATNDALLDHLNRKEGESNE